MTTGSPLPHLPLPDDGPVRPAPDTGAGQPSGNRPSRRRFLLGAGVLTAAGVAGAAALKHPLSGGGRPAAGAAAAGTGPAAAGGAGTGTLVLVTLYGGNDGLNTVIPYTDSAYHSGRPDLGYQPDQVIPLVDGMALNAQLKGLKSLWDAGQLAVVRGVGYPNPSLSHFQSMDVWQSANPDGNGPGWLGTWLDRTGTDPMRAVSIGTTLPPLLRGQRSAATAITRPTITLPGRRDLQGAYAALTAPGPDRTGQAASVSSAGADLLRVRGELDQLTTAGTTASTPPAGARAGALAAQLEMVASLIKAGAPTRVYQVSLGGFDTHAAEKANQERLLGELDQGVTAFFTALQGASKVGGVVLMTYSEFGRRVAQNASGGTDHGTAAPLFVAGPGVKGGRLYGDQPPLTGLDTDGNLRYTVDFRAVYATMLAGVIGVDPKSILGQAFPLLPLV